MEKKTNSEPLIIILNGMDFSGKSTVLDFVFSELTHVINMEEIMRKEKTLEPEPLKVLNCLGEKPLEKEELASLIESMSMFDTQLAEIRGNPTGKKVICQDGLWMMKGFGLLTALGEVSKERLTELQERLERYRGNESNSKIMSFYLQIPPELARARFLNRPPELRTKSDRMVLRDGYYMRANATYLSLVKRVFPNTEVINTESISAKETAKRIVWKAVNALDRVTAVRETQLDNQGNTLVSIYTKESIVSRKFDQNGFEL